MNISSAVNTIHPSSYSSFRSAASEQTEDTDSTVKNGIIEQDSELFSAIDLSEDNTEEKNYSRYR
jgi:hypothetical protein